MQLVLRKDVDRLGKIGDIVNVKRGYARNYLLPHGLAMAVSATNIAKIEVEKKVEIQPEEILVSTQPNKGLAVAADKFITVAVDANITPELRSEGLAREVVRRIQAMRKNAGFNIEDRITTYFQAQGELLKVMTDWGDYVKAETLSNILISGEMPPDVYTESHNIEGQELVLGVERI